MLGNKGWLGQWHLFWKICSRAFRLLHQEWLWGVTGWRCQKLQIALQKSLQGGVLEHMSCSDAHAWPPTLSWCQFYCTAPYTSPCRLQKFNPTSPDLGYQEIRPMSANAQNLREHFPHATQDSVVKYTLRALFLSCSYGSSHLTHSQIQPPLRGSSQNPTLLRNNWPSDLPGQGSSTQASLLTHCFQTDGEILLVQVHAILDCQHWYVPWER